MSTGAKRLYTPEEYLALERTAEYRSEYYRGEIFAMAGASGAHINLADNLRLLVQNQLRGRGCRAYSSEMKVHVPAAGLFTYPDLAVACGEKRFHERDSGTLLNPVLIAEVLSPSTEVYDRSLKFENYQSIPSLQQYVLVAQDRVHVDVFTRTDRGWLLTSASTLEAVIELASIGCTLPLAKLYEEVDFVPAHA